MEKNEIIRNVCCVCLKYHIKDSVLENLTQTIEKMLFECFSVQFQAYTTLRICNECIEKTVSYQKFRTEIIKNHYIFVDSILTATNTSEILEKLSRINEAEVMVKIEFNESNKSKLIDIKEEGVESSEGNEIDEKTYDDGKTSLIKPEEPTSDHKCQVCHRSFKGNQALKRHNTVIHKMTNTKSKKSRKRKIEMGKSTNESFKCSSCSMEFASKIERYKHKQASHKKNIVCYICGKLYKNQKQHMMLHELEDEERSPTLKMKGTENEIEEAKKHECYICFKTYKNVYVLKTHVKQIHSKQEFVQCQFCDKRIKTQNYKVHYNLQHAKRSRFTCNVCGKLCPAANALAQHMRAHTNERPFPCKHCGQSFRNRRTLGAHEMRHTDERPHKCDLCNLAFKQLWTMKMHRRTHTGQKDYVCSVCLQAFTQRTTMMTHMKRHKRDEWKR